MGIKQPVLTHRGILNSKRRLKDPLSVDFSSVGDSGDERMMGVQIVDPNNRYHHPKSKLNDSDMLPGLTLALGNDLSIQRLPEIPSRNFDGNAQAFYSSQAELQTPSRMKDLANREATYRSTTSEKSSKHLVKTRITMPQSLVN